MHITQFWWYSTSFEQFKWLMKHVCLKETAAHCDLLYASVTPMPSYSLSLLHSWSGKQVTVPILSRKFHRRRGSVDLYGQTMSPSEPGRVLGTGRPDAPPSLQRRCNGDRCPIRCRYATSNGEWPVHSLATITHWFLAPNLIICLLTYTDRHTRT